MTRLFLEDTHVPVTVLEAGPCPVVQVREGEAQLGFRALKPKRTPKARAGHVKPPHPPAVPRVLKTFSASAEAAPKLGDSVTVAIFNAGDRVKITGITKGR